MLMLMKDEHVARAITGRDLLPGCVGTGDMPGSRLINAYASARVIPVTPETDVADAAKLPRSKSIPRLAVTYADPAPASPGD